MTVWDSTPRYEGEEPSAEPGHGPERLHIVRIEEHLLLSSKHCEKNPYVAAPILLLGILQLQNTDLTSSGHTSASGYHHKSMDTLAMLL